VNDAADAATAAPGDLIPPSPMDRDRLASAVRGGAAWGVGARVLGAATSILVLPIAVRSLGAAQFGALGVVLGVVAILQVADLGAANAVIRPLAGALGRGDLTSARELVGSARWLLVLAGAGVALLGGATVLVGDLDRRLGLEGTPGIEGALAVVVVAMAVGLPLTLGPAVLLGAQRAASLGRWRILTAVLVLVAVVVAAAAEADLIGFTVAVVVVPVAVAAVQQRLVLRSTGLVGASRPTAERTTESQLLRAGAAFFLLQLAAVFAYNTDPFIISWRLGPEAVTDYLVPGRLFLFIQSLGVIATVPLWPAFADAFARDDHRWIAATARRWLLWVAVGTGGAALVAVAVGTQAVELLAGDEAAAPSLSLLLGFATWAVLGAVANLVAMVLHAAGRLRIQVAWSMVMVTANLLATVWAVDRYGIEGAIWATVVTNLALATIPLGLVARRTVKLAT
jgi:O-antigen/teichoic acid export membrane protein